MFTSKNTIVFFHSRYSRLFVYMSYTIIHHHFCTVLHCSVQDYTYVCVFCPRLCVSRRRRRIFRL